MSARLLPLVLAPVLALACADPAPAPLPARALPDSPPPRGRMVRAGAVGGYLAQPGGAAAGLPGEVVLVDQIDEPGRAWALDRAARGTVVLLVAPPVDPAAAQAYLAGTAAVDEARLRCRRAACPPETTP